MTTPSAVVAVISKSPEPISAEVVCSEW